MVRRAVVAFVVLFALTVALQACGGDPYSGTWSDVGHTKYVIAKANDGWYSIGATSSSPSMYAAELNGRLETNNARWTFSQSGDKLVMSGPDGISVQLTRQ
jgi:hypothetical protein